MHLPARALLALFLASAPAACAQLPGAPAAAGLPARPGAMTVHPSPVRPETTLEVTAEARISKAPDIAYITAGVTEERASASDAMTAQAAAMNGVFSALGTAGIAGKDIQTSGLSLYPRYDYIEVAQRDGSVRGEQRLGGYVAANTLTARVRSLGTLGAVIDNLVRAGGNTISGVSFAIEDDQQVRNEARAQAMQEAIARAGLYAGASGLRVARIVSIREGGEQALQPVMVARAGTAMDAGAPTPVAGGELGVTARVSVLFELVN